MFSSIRSRLWLTYAITIISALLVIAVIFFIYLVSNPLIYRQTRLRLAVVVTELTARQSAWSNLPSDQLQTELAIQDNQLEARLLLLGSNRQILADSRAGSEPTLETRSLLRLIRLNPTVINDSQGQPWLFVSRALNNGNYLIAAVPRPKISLVNIITDELIPPLFWGGLLALILALFIAFWMARWVADPLQGLINATQNFSGSQVSPLEMKGPKEVQELVGAYNQMTARVESSQKAQREFVANVSHELKTPLTSIQGFAQALLDGTASTVEEQKQSTQIIFNEAGRMHRLVLDLLDLARLDAGIADFKRVPVDLLALLKSIGERFGPQASRNEIKIEILTNNLPAVTGDGDRLAQVFSNLLDNALKFTPTGGKITINSSISGAFLNISVTDTGNGIPKEALPHIFERFYQIDASRQGGEKHGAGLGLAIVREIIQTHGGHVIVKSQVGQGSEFIVSLPITNSQATSITKKSSRSGN